jgi:starch phosphorylase
VAVRSEPSEASPPDGTTSGAATRGPSVAADRLPRPIRASVDDFMRRYLENLHFLRGVDRLATPNDRYQALSRTVRQYLMPRWLETIHALFDRQAKTVCYFSAEYLPGRQLDNTLLATGLDLIAQNAMAELGLDLDALREVEEEPGLGNGGLGRLASCLLDSLATLGIPAVGYGIRYEYGIFRQTFEDGRQVEQPDLWLRLGNPWEFPHPEQAVEVGFEGHCEWYRDDDGADRVRWLPGRRVQGVPYNVMVPGCRGGLVNTLRLWRARASREFDLQIFSAGDYTRAVYDKTVSENITKVLYPDDTTPQGRQLRLEQQYFFVACSLRDILRFLPPGFDMRRLPERVVIQLNDTHPAIAVAELMRLLVDEHRLAWDDAWHICRCIFAYTLHTLMPEALETWPVELIARLLPRHYEIIGEIDRRLCEDVGRRFPGDEARVARMAIVADGDQPRVRMAHLAAAASFAINGVAPLQSRLLREHTLRDFAAWRPDVFTNVTNGVSPRRFLRLANPRLSALICDAIGEGWLTNLDRLRELESFAADPAFREEWRRIKAANKADLADILHARTGVAVDPASMFDVMAKRLHEYKRQLLKVLHVIALYDRITTRPRARVAQRTVVFGAKAAPGYRMAKLIILLINRVAATINADQALRNRLTVAYPPNFNVTLAERFYPAADLSEQISLAGTEASGTGNMKFALNGALTIGTLDGANIEIRELVGPENFFLFGLTEEAVAAKRAAGYNPRAVYEADPVLKRTIDLISSGVFSPAEPGLFRPIVDALLNEDRYLVLADFGAYLAAQEAVERAYRDVEEWTRMSILNVARSGYFSSDRSVREYQERIWRVGPLAIGSPVGTVATSGEPVAR